MKEKLKIKGDSFALNPEFESFALPKPIPLLLHTQLILERAQKCAPKHYRLRRTFSPAYCVLIGYNRKSCTPNISAVINGDVR
ncbi:hypothetical protein JZ751_001074, partial [Albula glossodonta]